VTPIVAATAAGAPTASIPAARRSSRRISA
jgi:hypothetical protein